MKPTNPSRQMLSEPPYNALLATAGGTFPAGGLARDDFAAAACPVYMRIEEHCLFHLHTPAPPPRPDATTGDEACARDGSRLARASSASAGTGRAAV
ncbi:hypothetical protein C8R43DRAFT_1131889 [Mycena crocata]|nr:hypothetical protein C8R43DRAFT_1131889 [Mycena crocata]